VPSRNAGKRVYQSGKITDNKEREIICHVVVCCSKEAKDDTVISEPGNF
jgi:hypothetical protein